MDLIVQCYGRSDAYLFLCIPLLPLVDLYAPLMIFCPMYHVCVYSLTPQ